MKEQEQIIPELTSKHEQIIMHLKQEVASLRNQLQEEKSRADQPSPVLISLQKETAKLKVGKQCSPFSLPFCNHWTE